jgi:hypothetical protein
MATEIDYKSEFSWAASRKDFFADLVELFGESINKERG